MAHEIGPSRQVQIAHVATQFYLRGKSRVDIADEIGLSRFKVGRLLEEAVESGIVQFTISSPSGLRLDLSLELAERYSLTNAVVVDVPSEDAEAMQLALGATAADLLTDILTDDDVLGITSGRTLSAMARKITSLPRCDVVQLAGVAGQIQETGLETMRRISTVAGVRPWTIYAPLVVSDRSTAEGIRRQPETSLAFDQFPRVTVAVGAIGSWQPADSLMIENPALLPAERSKLLDLGVVAEFGATLLTDSGEVVHEIDDRCIAVSEEQLRKIPSVIAVAGGATKTRAIRAALASRLITGLVTDSATAGRLLSG